MVNINIGGHANNIFTRNKFYLSNDFMQKTVMMTVMMGVPSILCANFVGLISSCAVSKEQCQKNYDIVFSSITVLSGSFLSTHGDDHQLAAGTCVTGLLISSVNPYIGVPLMGVGIAYELYHNMYGVEQI